MDNKAVLIVEDDKDNIRGTKALLENRGMHVDVVESIEAARTALGITPYDVLLVDWTLPAIKDGPNDTEAGGKILKSLRNGEFGTLNKSVKYFIITKQRDQFDRKKRQPAGQLGVLSKLDALTIVNSVVDVLSTKGR